ncbi:MAG TPA: TetR family transcriptional regulator, partial [Massilia sp.]|nr:TetR family transcriptional regulator [Massilia sp.]
MKTKTSLLTAAERLFDTHGFMATGMDRLAAAAGM